MAFEYKDLTTAERLTIVTSRLKELESEHYSNALMREALAQAEDVDDRQRAALLTNADQQLTSLERAIAIHREEQARLRNGASPE
jgi:ATP-dependent DNA ligase